MATQQYAKINFHSKTYDMIKAVNLIVADYMAQGMRLTVRQLYYQLVSKNIIPNTMRAYHNVVRNVNDGRMAGLIDWDAIEDRTRSFLSRSRWTMGGEILDSAARSYHMDLWATQPSRVYVIIEKEALTGVLSDLCNEYDVPLLAARGYPSVSVLREFGHDELLRRGSQSVHVLHLGDHDPSGLDMTGDLQNRIAIFSEGDAFNLHRIGLTMEQIRTLKLPSNPAKQTDARFKDYSLRHGSKSWELDALPPDYLQKLVKKRIEREINWTPWNKQRKKIERIRGKIKRFADKFKD